MRGCLPVHQLFRCSKIVTFLVTHSIEQLLADLPPPPHVRRHPILPLLSERTQTTAHLYENTDFTTSLSAHRYADTPLYVNTSPSNAPLSQAIEFGQSNVTDVPNLYAQSYASDLNSSSMVAFQPTVCTSYADNSQRLPIVVEQPGFSVFFHVQMYLTAGLLLYNILLVRQLLLVQHHCSLHLYTGGSGWHIIMSNQI